MTRPRVVRGLPPKKTLKRHSYADCKTELIRDFKSRCAYSMQHLRRAGGEKCMEVDHFDPSKKADYIQQYSNLFLASRHCNGAKQDAWPTKADQRKGVRLLNCCEETDYGVHIFEDPENYLLVGVTPAGRYHIRNCDLNAPHLVQERRERTQLKAKIEAAWILVKAGKEQQVIDLIKATRNHIDLMIPPIPPLNPKAAE